jgi:hypothetical protein
MSAELPDVQRPDPDTPTLPTNVLICGESRDAGGPLVPMSVHQHDDWLTIFGAELRNQESWSEPRIGRLCA